MNAFYKAALIVVGVLLLGVIVMLFLDSAGERKTRRDIEAIRDGYERIEESYLGIRDEVGAIGNAVAGYKDQFDGMEKRIIGRLGSVENQVNGIGNALRESKIILDAISSDAGRIEKTNGRFLDLIRELDSGITAPK